VPANETDTEAEEPNPDWKVHLSELRHAVVIVVLLTLVCGALFPALVIGFGEVVFPGRAAGSLMYNADGQVVIGSKNVGQNFSGAEYLHPRPSGAGPDGYDASASSGRNFAPSSPGLTEAVSDAAEAYREENGLPDDAVLPADAVTASASGLDPHISPANARLQADRVAEARGVPVEEVLAMVEEHTSGRLLWFLGEPRVNVLELNLALDAELPIGGGED
jgi:K+-transporting ATPase ATPase C chain